MTFKTTAILGILASLLSHAGAFSYSNFQLPSASRRFILIGPSTTLLKSTLNEDGDFCIEGINDDKTTNSSNNNDEFTSLLDMQYNQVKNSKLSDIMKPHQSVETTNPQDVRLETIDDYVQNDEKDIMDRFSSILNSGFQGNVVSSANNKDLSRTANRMDSTLATTASVPIVSQSGRGQLLPQSLDEEDDQAAIEALEGFLGSIFDGQVTARDIHMYACELVAIGFDPDCDLGKELEFDDLEFMKKLHQRFYWKEWQKLI